jgi:AcrR family transcriptional regulator
MPAQKRLNRDELVTTALAVADAEGLDAVTIRRVAQQHDVTPMALYRHFPDKEGVLDAMAERMLADVTLAAPDDRPWPEQMRDLLTAFLAALRPHPNATPLIFPRMISCEPGLDITERTLALLTEAGMSVQDAADTACHALSSLITLVVSEPGRVQSHDPELNEETVRTRRALLLTLPPRRYPHVIACADALAGCASQEAYYVRGVDLIVTGMRGALPSAPALV